MEIIDGVANRLPIYKLGSADDSELLVQRCLELGRTECLEDDLIGLEITVYEGKKSKPKETMIMIPIHEAKNLVIALQNLLNANSTAVGK